MSVRSKFEKTFMTLALVALMIVGAVTTVGASPISNQEWTNGSETVYISPSDILVSETGSAVRYLEIVDSGTGEITYDSESGFWVYRDGYLYHNGSTWWTTYTGITSDVGNNGTVHMSDSEVYLTMLDHTTAAVGQGADNSYYYYTTHYVFWDGKLAIINTGEYDMMVLFNGEDSAVCNVLRHHNNTSVSLGYHWIGRDY